MKMVYYKFNSNKGQKKEKKPLSISFERLLFISFVLAFAVLIVVQSALVTPTTRSFVLGNNELDGAPLGIEEYIYPEGQIRLELKNQEENDSLKVLVNGEAVTAFSEKKVDISVKDGDIIELDASGLEQAAVVSVSSKSENIITDCVDKTIQVKNGIERFIKINIDDIK